MKAQLGPARPLPQLSRRAHSVPRNDRAFFLFKLLQSKHLKNKCSSPGEEGAWRSAHNDLQSLRWVVSEIPRSPWRRDGTSERSSQGPVSAPEGAGPGAGRAQPAHPTSSARGGFPQRSAPGPAPAAAAQKTGESQKGQGLCRSLLIQSGSAGERQAVPSVSFTEGRRPGCRGRGLSSQPPGPGSVFSDTPRSHAPDEAGRNRAPQSYVCGDIVTPLRGDGNARTTSE